MDTRYSILIQWSPEDECFLALLPEWGESCIAHGETYAQALKSVLELLEVLIECEADGELPTPRFYEG